MLRVRVPSQGPCAAPRQGWAGRERASTDMSTNLDAAFPLVHHTVPPGLGLGDASWARLGLQLGWVVLSYSLAVLGCSALCATQ